MNEVIERMKAIFKDVPYGIDHTLKVMDNAKKIMDGENCSNETRAIVLLVTALHDIGAIEAQKKHGSMEGRYQEMEGPAIARRILKETGHDSKTIERVCFIIGNHHSPSKIDGEDFQIRWEADLIENMTALEIIQDEGRLHVFIEQNFKTKTGKQLATKRFMK